MHFLLHFDMDSPAFKRDGVAGVQDILIRLSGLLERLPDSAGGFVKDSDYKTVGEWRITNYDE